MGRKKKYPELEDVAGQPWCYYCERAFDDLKILISHQKAKHFKCERCGRRLNTAGGLSVHLNQVHKEQLTKVDNALPEREGLGVEIFGMEGIPEDIRQRHEKRVVEQYFKEQKERRDKTGNPAPGSKEALAPKPSKFGDDDDELVKRFKEHIAKVDRGEVLGVGSALEGVQPTTATIMPSVGTPDQAPSFVAPGYMGQPPVGFPPGPMPYSGQPPFQPPFAGSPPFAQGPSLAPPGPLPPPPAASGFSRNGPSSIVNDPVQAGIDDLIANAQAAAAAAAAAAASANEPTIQPPASSDKTANMEKAAGKKVPKGQLITKMVWTDAEFSPEERMALLPRYAYPNI